MEHQPFMDEFPIVASIYMGFHSQPCLMTEGYHRFPNITMDIPWPMAGPSGSDKFRSLQSPKLVERHIWKHAPVSFADPI